MAWRPADRRGVGAHLIGQVERRIEQPVEARREACEQLLPEVAQLVLIDKL